MNTRRIPAILFLFLLCCLLAFQVLPTGIGTVAAATDWYVATTGSDTTGDGSSGSPWKTIGYAVSNANVQAGDTVHVLGGKYDLASQVLLNKANLTLAGAGSAYTHVDVSGTGYGFYINAAGVTISGFQIDKTDKTGPQNIIYVGANNVSITNNEIAGKFAIGDVDVSRAMEVAGELSGLNISGNTIYDLRQPAYINGVTTGTISNNYVYLTMGWVLAEGNMTFTNNTWGTSANANFLDIAILAGVNPTYYTDIPAMAAANNGAFIEDQRTSPATLSIVYVDGSVAASGNGTATSPVKTITEGVTRVVTGGTVHVGAGTYIEKVIINKTLTLNGANVGISAGATPGTRGSESIIQGGVQIQGNNVVFDGFKIDGPGTFGGQNDGIYVVGGTSGHTIANNILAGHGRTQASDGWAMDFSAGTSGIAVRNNYIGNWWSTYINPTNPGSNLLFEGNHFDSNHVGIGSDGLNDVNIQYNKFTGNNLEGFGTSNVGSSVRAHYNDFVGNAAGINHHGGGQTVDATNNWWGDATGPYNAASNPSGLGNAVSSNVVFIPWTGMAAPTVTSVSPAQGTQGQTLSSVVITGTTFVGLAPTGAVSFGSDVTVNSYTVDNATQITANITIPAGTGTGAKDVSVTNSAGTGTRTGGFTVNQAGAPPGWYEQFTANGDAGGYVYGLYRTCQTFTPATSHYFDMASFLLYTQGSPTYTVTIALYRADANHQPTGTVLCSTTFAASSLTTTAKWYEYGFTTGYQLLAGNEYAIVLSGNGGTSANMVLAKVTSAGGYSRGTGGFSANGGATWTTFAWDVAFKEGQMGPPGITVVSPTQAFPGDGLYVVITGSSFTGATSVSFGDNISVTYTVNSLSQITALIHIDPSATVAARDVTVTTPLGTATRTGGFAVVAVPPPAAPGWYEQFTAWDYGDYVYGSMRACQTFTPATSHYFDMASFLWYKVGSPNYAVTIALYRADANHRPTGTVLCSTTFAASSVVGTVSAPTWYEYGFTTGYQLLAGNEYAIVLSGNGGTSANQIIAKLKDAGGYSGGTSSTSSDGGATWTTFASDVAFKEGQMGPPGITGVNPSQALPGDQLYVVITGNFFVGATSVSFGDNISVTYTVNSLSQITALIHIDPSATVAARDVTVTTPLGTATRTGGFAVVAVPPPAAPGWYEQFTAWDYGAYVYGTSRACQTFTPTTSHYFDMASFLLYKVGSPNYTVTIALYRADGNHHPTGTVLCSTTFAASSVVGTAAAPTWYEYGFTTGYQLLAGNEYAIVLSGNGGTSANQVIAKVKDAGGYSGGTGSTSTDGGATWTTFAWDLAFKEGQS